MHLKETTANFGLHKLKVIPWLQINAQESLSLWGYEDNVLGPLYALPLGDLESDIAGSLELFSSFIPAEGSVSCDCANNRGRKTAHEECMHIFRY